MITVFISLFANLWIWRIFQFNFLLCALLILLTFLLYLTILENKKFKWYIVLGIFLIVFLFQWKTTTPQSLILLDNDEQRIQKTRLQFYNPSSHYLRVLFARFNLKDFLEGDFNTVSTRLTRNFFESMDPNIYFFAGHPRERVWAKDFEKFPFFFAVPFFWGFYKLIQTKNLYFYFSIIAPIILLSFIGHKNDIGPFSLFPVMVLSINSGLLQIIKFFKRA